MKIARHVAVDECDPHTRVHRKPTVLPLEDVGGRSGVEQALANRTGGESLRDAALDGALTLASMALARRDEAGMLCFDEAVTRWLPPRGGSGQLNRMVAAPHDVQPRLFESRFDTALLHIERSCRKRTLLVVITNLIDDRNA